MNKPQTKHLTYIIKLFGKEPWEIEYGDKCPLCNEPIVVTKPIF